MGDKDVQRVKQQFVWGSLNINSLKQPRVVARIWEAYDVNGNGSLERSEVFKLAEDWIAAKPEVCKMWSPKLDAAELTDALYMFMDRDKNKALSNREWMNFFK